MTLTTPPSDIVSAETPTPIAEPLRVAIVDDDVAAVHVLANALRQYGERVEIVGTATDLDSARAMIREVVPDMVFLDIEFPEEDESGLDLVNLPEEMGADIDVVFYTSYSRYLIQALRMQAFDFLLKPIDEEELSIIINRYFLRRDTPPRHTAFYGAIPSLQERRDTKAISITTVTNDRIIVAPSNILFFKFDSDRKLWEVVLHDLQRFILKRHTTSDIILSYGPDFIRTHQSYIVNVAYLGMITPTQCTLLPPYTDITEIKISKSFRRQLLDRFYDL